MYRPVPRDQIADALVHLRKLFRQIHASNDKERRIHERREVVTKNLLSNLSRTKEHPTLHVVLELADIFSLTIEGAHRLFGYELEKIREYDLRLNAGRTHIERPHERLCSGEVHRSLCMSRARERERNKCWPYYADGAKKLKGGDKAFQSSTERDNENTKG